MSGKEVKATRYMLGLTQLQLAKHLHVPHLTVCRWERGLMRVRQSAATRLKHLARALYSMGALHHGATRC
jgi:DNA-binding transcriptional regulator YiaG